MTVVTRRRLPVFAHASSASATSAQIPRFFAERGFAVYAYCVMPDHVHLLLEGRTPSADLVEAVRGWKQHTGYAWKQRHGAHLWQSGFHDRVLRDGDDTRAVVRYVLENPVRAGLARVAED